MVEQVPQQLVRLYAESSFGDGALAVAVAALLLGCNTPGVVKAAWEELLDRRALHLLPSLAALPLHILAFDYGMPRAWCDRVSCGGGGFVLDVCGARGTSVFSLKSITLASDFRTGTLYITLTSAVLYAVKGHMK